MMDHSFMQKIQPEPVWERDHGQGGPDPDQKNLGLIVMSQLWPLAHDSSAARPGPNHFRTKALPDSPGPFSVSMSSSCPQYTSSSILDGRLIYCSMRNIWYFTLCFGSYLIGAAQTPSSQGVYASKQMSCCNYLLHRLTISLLACKATFIPCLSLSRNWAWHDQISFHLLLYLKRSSWLFTNYRATG